VGLSRLSRSIARHQAGSLTERGSGLATSDLDRPRFEVDGVPCERQGLADAASRRQHEADEVRQIAMDGFIVIGKSYAKLARLLDG
jgi:hypothetical protein